ncbi:MAG: phosphotransferase [Deltaproteobacteria bacterium]|jgi:Ser/Thr protein kinase RdoA (MazF antagonist)|nr:phosphotransferase [Deltaproteobacteria bacterium]MBW2531512.1 phosphotransferase [Deltaproteobacteria bacterium]
MLEAERVQAAVSKEHLARALARYAEASGADVTPLGAGLINDTFAVRGPSGRFVLQRVNPIFDPAIHHNILAVTDRLAARGVDTPRLVPSREGTPWIDLGPGGVWRLSTFVDGASFDVPTGAQQTRAAGALVARFHGALAGMEHDFVGQRLGVHDTERHLERLRAAVSTHREHRLAAAVARLADRVLAAAEALPPLPRLAQVIGHGDLKFNNLRFAGRSGRDAERPLCLIDLDTLGPLQLAHELGDGWRSWCNPGGEEDGAARFDLDLFAAAWSGYREASAAPLPIDQRRALLMSVEWISLELSARFAADALLESYFGWDSTRFATRGDHNLARARSQWALHESTVAHRRERARLLGIAPTEYP